LKILIFSSVFLFQGCTGCGGKHETKLRDRKRERSSVVEPDPPGSEIICFSGAGSENNIESGSKSIVEKKNHVPLFTATFAL
jgi:hypothetical protein